MAADSQGLSLTGSGEAVAAYDRAIEHLIRFQPAVVDAAAESAAADPGCVMGRVFGAYLGTDVHRGGRRGGGPRRAGPGRRPTTARCCPASAPTWPRRGAG